jgi:hypothetical protein
MFSKKVFSCSSEKKQKISHARIIKIGDKYLFEIVILERYSSKANPKVTSKPATKIKLRIMASYNYINGSIVCKEMTIE